MKKEKIEELGRLGKKEPTEDITFQTVESDSNILKAQVFKDGRKHTVYVLAVPEDNIKNFQEEEENIQHTEHTDLELHEAY